MNTASPTRQTKLRTEEGHLKLRIREAAVGDCTLHHFGVTSCFRGYDNVRTVFDTTLRALTTSSSARCRTEEASSATKFAVGSRRESWRCEYPRPGRSKPARSFSYSLRYKKGPLSERKTGEVCAGFIRSDLPLD